MSLEPGISLMVLLLILIMQTAAIGAIVLLLYRAAARASRVLDDMKGLLDSARLKVDGTVEETKDLISSWEDVGRHMSDIAADVKEIVENARDTTEDLADVIQDTTIRGERQIERVDHLLTKAVDRTASATDYLTRSVYPQLVEIAALIKGIYVTVEYLKGKRRFPTPG